MIGLNKFNARPRLGLLALLLALCGPAAADFGRDGTGLSLRLDLAASELGSVARAGGAAPATEYRIDTGDAVTITVYGEPDLSVQAVAVGGEGKISMPLIGEIEIRGLSSRELEALVKAKLKDGYLKKPSVTVRIDTYRLFFIKGEVRNPGGYNYAEGLTIEKAVALAGGYTERASEDKLTVVRESQPGSLLSARPGTPIRPGDIVTVGESFF